MITIGQNNSYIFIDENNIAKKVFITIVKVEGEAAEIKVNLPSEAKIIITNSKILQDGDPVIVK